MRGEARTHTADHAERLDAALLELLDATEALCAALADDSPAEAWAERLARRDRAFAEVERAATLPGGGRGAPGAGGRACLERIAELDAAILQAGGQELARVQRERLALGGRRRAVSAHALQPRETPRVVTVKA